MLTLSLFIVCYFVQFCVYTSLYYICMRHCIASRYRGINYTFDFDSLSNIGRARCAAINSDFLKIIISKYINYTIGINDNNCVFVCNLILGW